MSLYCVLKIRTETLLYLCSLIEFREGQAVFTEAKSGINDPGLSKTAVLSRCPSPGDEKILVNKSTLSSADIGGRLMSSANLVRSSSQLQSYHEFHKFLAKKPGLLYLDHFLTVYCILRQDFKKNVSNYILEVINQMIF
jgi:hypothetical protein